MGRQIPVGGWHPGGYAQLLQDLLSTTLNNQKGARTACLEIVRAPFLVYSGDNSLMLAMTLLRCSVLTAFALLYACTKPQPAQETAPIQPAPSAPAQPTPPPAAPPPAEPTSSAEPVAAPGDQRAGWSTLRRQDDLPLCVFAGYPEREKAPLLASVKGSQKLRANAKLVFGVFGPHCLNDACDERPTLQCWVEREGKNVIVVHSRFSSEHKDGSSCTQDCMELDLACETEDELAPGKYSVRYGDKTTTLTIPGTLRDPCLRRE